MDEGELKTDPHAGSAALAYPPARYTGYVIGVLMLVTVISFLDRQLPALLVQPIRATFRVSDTEISLLQGYAFALVYAFMGLPFGRLVDRANRRNLIVFGIVTWSAMTLLSGLVRSFPALIACRMGVGMGEACLGPAAFSLIADYVEPKRHGWALGVYYTAFGIGSGASLFFGGLLLRVLPQKGPIAILGHGAFEPWQLLFVLAGLPGLLVAGLLFTVREAPRRDPARLAGAPRDKATIAEFLGYVRANGRTFVHVYSCYALSGFVGYAVSAWAATFYLRRFGLPLSQVGMTVGALSAVLGVAGPLATGLLSDRWAQTASGGRFQVLLAPTAVLIPALICWMLVRNLYASFALFAVISFALNMASSSAPSTIQSIVPNRMRGQAVACSLLVSYLIGFALGPTAVALMTDHVFHDDRALGYSIIAVATPALVACLVLGWSGLRAYRTTLDGAVRLSA